MSKTQSPPLFNNFGKDAKDLFKKTFDFDNQLIYKSNSPYELETRIVAANDAPLRGVFKTTINTKDVDKLNGKFESEFHTVADKESKTSYTFNNLAKGVSVKVGLTAVKADVKGETPDFPEGFATVEAEYKQENFAGSVGVRTNGQKTLADVVLSLGYKNITVGEKVVIDTASKTAPTDYNFGAQYSNANVTASAFTEKKHTALTLSYYQKVSRSQNIGASATIGLVKPTRTLQFGSDFDVDIDTKTRTYVKIDSSKDSATVGLSITHRLPNPAIQIGVATEYNVSPSAVSAGKFGVSISLGDL